MTKEIGTTNYTPDQKRHIVDYVCGRMETGLSWRDAMKDPSKGKGKKGQICANATFFSIIDNDASYLKQYTRAREIFHTVMAEKIVAVASKVRKFSKKKTVDTPDGVIISEEIIDNTPRTQQQVNAMIWYLSKCDPKRFGKYAGGSEEFVEQPLFDDID